MSAGLPTTGFVVSIYITAAASAPMVAVDQVHALTGRGLEGDRYADQAGSYSDVPKPGRQVTLIEAEAVEAAGQASGVAFTAAESRRNLVTRGVSLNDLVGQVFQVGEVRLRGTELCEPCAYMARLCGKPVLHSLVHRGGLRAEILEGGRIRAGDPVVVLAGEVVSTTVSAAP